MDGFVIITSFILCMYILWEAGQVKLLPLSMSMLPILLHQSNPIVSILYRIQYNIDEHEGESKRTILTG